MDTAQALGTLGIPGLVVVVLILAGVIVSLYKSSRSDIKEERSKLEAVQEQRLSDAKETRDKITEPLEANAKLTEKIYELLLSSGRKG